MEPLELSLERPELDDALSSAYLRVEQYLCSMQIHNKRILSELAHAILNKVRRRLEAGDTLDPVTIAMDELDRHLSSWYAEVIEADDLGELSISSRMSLFNAHMPNRWTRYFLRSGPWPAEFRDEMKKMDLRSKPDELTGSKMKAIPLDLGTVGKLAEDTWSLFGRWPVLGVLFLSGAYMLMVGFIVYFAS